MIKIKKENTNWNERNRKEKKIKTMNKKRSTSAHFSIIYNNTTDQRIRNKKERRMEMNRKEK